MGNVISLHEFSKTRRQDKFNEYNQKCRRFDELSEMLGFAYDDAGNSLFGASLHDDSAKRLLQKLRANHPKEYAEYERLMDELDVLGEELGIDAAIDKYEASPEFEDDIRKQKEWREARLSGADIPEPVYSDKYYDLHKFIRGEL